MTASGGQAELILDVATAAGLAAAAAVRRLARARSQRVDRHHHRRRQPARRLGQRRLRDELPARASACSARIPATTRSPSAATAPTTQPLGTPERFMTYARHAGRGRRGVDRSPSTNDARARASSGATVTAFLREQRHRADRRHAPGPRRDRSPGALDRAARAAPPRGRSRHAGGSPPCCRAAARAAPSTSTMPSACSRRPACPSCGRRSCADPRGGDRGRRGDRLPGRAQGSSADDVPHRSDLGLVAVGLRDARELGEAWDRMAASARQAGGTSRSPASWSSRWCSGGVEVFAGVNHDPDFGPVLAFGARRRAARGARRRRAPAAAAARGRRRGDDRRGPRRGDAAGRLPRPPPADVAAFGAVSTRSPTSRGPTGPPSPRST